MDEARRTHRDAAEAEEHSLYEAMDDRSGGRRSPDFGPQKIERTHPQQPGGGKDGSDVRFRQILDALPVAVYTTDAAGLLTYYNRAAAELVGRQPKIGVDRWCVTWRLYTPDGTPLPLENCPMAIALAENRPVRNVEVLVERPNGALVPVMPYPVPLADSDGNVRGGVNTLVDISERKEAEAGQFGLLKELNHRVKNNLQMLLSLLSSAARESATEEARTGLTEASRRVAVIGAVQQVLYAGEGTGTTFNADALLHAVAAITPHGPNGPVEVMVRESGIVLTNDTAVPLALMLNELLSNAARYSGQAGTAGSVGVSLARNGERFALTVEDDGPGFVPALDGTKRASGLGLVRGLARQLGGTLTIDSHPGARCVVTFSDRSVH
jgi:PAS domain S-box-containing protein